MSKTVCYVGDVSDNSNRKMTPIKVFKELAVTLKERLSKRQNVRVS